MGGHMLSIGLLLSLGDFWIINFWTKKIKKGFAGQIWHGFVQSLYEFLRLTVMRFCRLRIHRTPTFDKEPIFMQCCFWASREESRDKNDIEPVVNQRLQDLPVGEKVGKTTYTGFLEPLPRIFFAKQKNGNLYVSRLPDNGGISRTRTYDLHDVKRP